VKSRMMSPPEWPAPLLAPAASLAADRLVR
jgi:hypothetical protein